MNKKTKIFVGVSGGVDSSVAAHILKNEEYEVHGVFVKSWSPDWLPCTWVEEKRDAMRVCASLNIPFHFLDAEEAYKNEVAEYMINEYRVGRTPNPDVLCNRVIKFGVLWDYARDNGAAKIATGHYAQTNGASLMKAADVSKDQSYFLWMLRKNELKHVLFPIGEMQKKDVRKIAERSGLFTAKKKDSQGICFLGDVDMKEFLSHYIENKEGKVLNTKGEVIGSHDGVWFYTLGERHGFKISAKDASSKPYYVIAKNVEKNTLTVSHDPRLEFSKGAKIILSLREQNWLQEFDREKKYQANIRYHGENIECQVLNEKTIILNWADLSAPGQSVVVYEGEIMVGGGIIDSIKRE